MTEIPLRTIVVLELLLRVRDQDDAAQQITGVARKITQLRDRSPGLRSTLARLRIAIDEPGTEQTATAVLDYLDATADPTTPNPVGPGHEWTPLGERQEVSSTRLASADARLTQLDEAARASGDHLWVATLAHQAGETLLDVLDGTTDETPILDPDSLLTAPLVGCYACEQPYRPDLRRTPCPGEPTS